MAENFGATDLVEVPGGPMEDGLRQDAEAKPTGMYAWRSSIGPPGISAKTVVLSLGYAAYLDHG